MTEQQWKKLRAKANEQADKEYTTEVSNVIHATKSEVAKVLKEADVDKERLSELMAVVSSKAKTNKQKARMITNSMELAQVAVALIKVLV